MRDLAPWTWFFHLTMVSRGTGERLSENVHTWFKEIAVTVVRDHVPVAWCLERGKSGHAWHTHGLLAAGRQSTTFDQRLYRAWREIDGINGFTALRRYEPDLGGAWYVIKDGEWFVEMVCPRPPRCRNRRGGGCCEAGLLRRS